MRHRCRSRSVHPRWLWRALAGLALLAAPTRTLLAQDDPASRANAARAAMTRAAGAQRAGFADSALAEAQRAHEAWPAQPAYAVSLARLAARRGDDELVARTLRTLAAQQAGLAATTDTSIAAAAARSPVVKVARDALVTSLRPVAGSRPRTLGADTLFFPEGLDADPRDGTLYLTSIRHRGVYAIAPDGAWREVIAARDTGFASVLGVRLDVARGSLWLTTGKLPYAEGAGDGDSTHAELLRVRLSDGAIEQRITLGEGKGIPGELALAPDGSVLVSDGAMAVLYRLRSGASELETIRSPLLRSPQGIAVDQAGAVAWVADWTHGLLRWDLRTGTITAVRALNGTTLVGIDGLVREGNSLYGVQNGITPARVVRITLDAAGTAVRAVRTIDRPQAIEGEPTVGTIARGNFIYVSSSGWPFWNEDGSRAPGAGALPPVVVRVIRLEP